MPRLYAEMVYQHVVFYGVALIKNIFVDRAGRSDTAFAGDLLEQLIQLLLLQRGGVGNGEGEAQSEQGGQTIHGGLLLTALFRPAACGAVHLAVLGRSLAGAGRLPRFIVTLESIHAPCRSPSAQRTPGQEPQTLRRSEEHTSELQTLMRISYAVF